MDFSPINTFATKLERDEIFTFLYGFALGLFLFLILFIDFPSGKLESIRLISSDPYLLIFCFLGLGLLFTFLAHVIYNLIGIPIFKLANKGIAGEIASEIPRIDWGLSTKSVNDWAHLLHTYQLSITAFIFLMIFPLFLKINYPAIRFFSLPILIYEAAFLTLFLIGVFYIKKEWRKFLKLSAMVNSNKVKIFSDEKLYSEYQNQLVQINFSNYHNSLILGFSRSFQNMIQGISNFIGP